MNETFLLCTTLIVGLLYGHLLTRIFDEVAKHFRHKRRLRELNNG